MLRRNIDVTLGLVNGTIGTISSFITDADHNVIGINVEINDT